MKIIGYAQNILHCNKFKNSLSCQMFPPNRFVGVEAEKMARAEDIRT